MAIALSHNYQKTLAECLDVSIPVTRLEIDSNLKPGFISTHIYHEDCLLRRLEIPYEKLRDTELWDSFLCSTPLRTSQVILEIPDDHLVHAEITTFDVSDILESLTNLVKEYA